MAENISIFEIHFLFLSTADIIKPYQDQNGNLLLPDGFGRHRLPTQRNENGPISKV